MSPKPEKVKTESEIDQDINVDLEGAADDVFGSDVEIAAQAAEEAGKQTPEDSEAQIKADEEKKAAEALEKENEGKTPEEIEKAAAEKKEADDAATKKGADDAEAKKYEGKTAEEITALKAEEKAAQEKEEKGEPYKVPDDLKGRTRERFEKLTGDLKTAHTLTEKQDGIIKGFREVIERTGMTPAEMQTTLDLGGLMKTNPTKALETLKGIVTQLSEQVGVVAPGANPLDGHDDLKQKVADRELSIEDANEIAGSRIKAAATKKADELRVQQTTEQQQNKQHQEQNQDQFNARVATAQSAVGEFLVTVQKDPDADKMAPHMIEAAKFAAENLAPEKWMEYIKGRHTEIKQIASAMTPPAGGATPIMDGGIPPGGNKEPKNMEQLADNML